MKFPWTRTLGRTGLATSCLAIGGGAGISSDDILYAFDKGIRTFFFSSDVHHFAYVQMAPALRKLCERGSRARDEVTLISVTYTRHPNKLMAVLYDIFRELRVDFVDVLMWGWVDIGDEASTTAFLAAHPQVVGPSAPVVPVIERWHGASERMRAVGAVRHLGVTFHDVPLAAFYAGDPALGVAMVRLNPSHRRAATTFFPGLPAAADRCGVMTFKSMASGFGLLFKKPPGWTSDWMPEPGDLYRYALSHPTVDVVLTGPRNREEIDHALASVEKGPLTAEEMALFTEWGDKHRGGWRPDDEIG